MDEVSANVVFNSLSSLELKLTMIDTIEVVPLLLDKTCLVMETLDALHCPRVKIAERKNPSLKFKVKQLYLHSLPKESKWTMKFLSLLHHGEVRSITTMDNKIEIIIVQIEAERKELTIAIHQLEE